MRFMKLVSCSISLIFINGLWVSCSSVEKKESEKQAPVCIGSINKVFSSQKFVLIKKEANIAIPEKDTVLLSQNESGTNIANLVVSGERLPTSVIFPADIRSGSPKLGERVFIYSTLDEGNLGVKILKADEKGIQPIELTPVLDSEDGPKTNSERNESLPDDLKKIIEENEAMPQ